MESQNKSPRCAHYNASYLKLSENWIYKTLINHRKFYPIFLTRKKENLPLFPLKSLYSLDDFSKTHQYLEIFIFKLLGYFPFLKEACVKNSVQLLHAHFGYQGIKMIGLKKKLKIPMVCSFYGDDAFVFRHTNGKNYDRLFKEAEKILVLGPYMKSALMKLGCPESKIFIHHLGIDVDKIRFSTRQRLVGDKVRFLIVSSFVEKKGIDLAIRALSKFKDRYDLTLDIIGDGPLRNKILEEIQVSGMKDRITQHGYKPYNYFIELAYQCDVLIQASRTGKENNKEGTPMSIVDAMATGMAILSTKHSDIPEIVIDGEHGYLAEENDLTSLESCIKKILDNPGHIALFGMKGRARVEEQFNARVQTQKLEDFYFEIIQRQSRS